MDFQRNVSLKLRKRMFRAKVLDGTVLLEYNEINDMKIPSRVNLKTRKDPANEAHTF